MSALVQKQTLGLSRADVRFTPKSGHWLSASGCQKSHWLPTEAVVGPKNPMVGSLPACCARAASGHEVADTAITLMKSRRRIALPEAQDYADCRIITAGICDRRNGVQLSFCMATIPRTQCPLWVKSGH